MSRHVQLPPPDTIDEGTCLLRDDGLPKIEETGDPIAAFFSYSTGREHLENDGLDEESYNVLPLDDINSTGEKMDIGTHFPPVAPTKSVIQVAVFNGCDINIVEKVLDEEPSAVGSGLAQARGLLESGLKKSGGFMTGISLRAKCSQPESLKLFSCFPYLGYRTHPALGNDSQQPAPGNTSQSLDLNQYRSQILDGPVIGSGDFSKILVHQAWFLLINDENVAILKSKEDKLSTRAPLFQYQQRLGIFHGLIQMISNTLTTSEAAVLKHIYEEIPRQESEIKSQVKDSSSANKSARRSAITSIADSISHFEDSLDDISSMIRVVQTQIELLQDLREIFQSSFGEDENVGEPRLRRNAVKIPFIIRAPEEIRVTIETINAIVKERETVRAGLSILLNDFKRSKVFLFQANQVSNEKAESMETHIKKQGQTITLFTFITTVFLPLGFFSQYFAIEFPTSVTKRGFWNISGSVTFVIIVLLSFFMFVPDDKMKKWITDPVKKYVRSKKNKESGGA